MLDTKFPDLVSTYLVNYASPKSRRCMVTSPIKEEDKADTLDPIELTAVVVKSVDAVSLVVVTKPSSQI